MHYKIYSENPSSHFLNIEMTIQEITDETIEIQLPAWRPGRYELQNFAKNIQQFEIFGVDNQAIPFKKTTKDRWQVHTSGHQTILLKFTYYANLINAGSSFVDDNRMYVNFVNCLPYVQGRLHEVCEVELILPTDFKVASGLTEITKNKLKANDFYELVDCPLLASPYLQHDSYMVGKEVFHLWFLGNYQPDFERIKHDFIKFSQAQGEVFGEFPFNNYHFLVQVLPTALYHGVEHHNSTCIVLGPDTETEDIYNDLLGVCSHELYHAWNICRIRPIEMLPYDFTQENYFPTGFVAEGVTTYLGDWFVKATGGFSFEEYLKEIGVPLKRHFEKDGRAFLSLVESSFDLWLDGYTPAIPDRRVSIYSKGALVALILDLSIRRKFDHTRSIHDVMRLMWLRFGKPFVGYSLFDYQQVAEEIYGDSLTWYMEECILGNGSLQNRLNDLLSWVGLQLRVDAEEQAHLDVLDAENENLKHWLGAPQTMKNL